MQRILRPSMPGTGEENNVNEAELISTPSSLLA